MIYAAYYQMTSPSQKYVMYSIVEPQFLLIVQIIFALAHRINNIYRSKFVNFALISSILIPATYILNGFFFLYEVFEPERWNSFGLELINMNYQRMIEALVVGLIILKFLHKLFLSSFRKRKSHKDIYDMSEMELFKQSEKICNKFWKWRLQNFPEYATSVNEHEYDERLTDLSLKGFSSRYKESKEILNEVETLIMKMKEQSLTNTNLEILASELSTFVNGFQHEPYLYPINICEGPHYNLPKLIQQMPQSEATDFDKILTRMDVFSTQIFNIIELMKEGVKRGKIMHWCSIGTVSNQLKSIVNFTIVKSPFFKCFSTKPLNISKETWNEIVQQASDTIESVIHPSLRILIEFLETDYLPHCREKISVETLPRGKEYYKSCLRYHTSTDLSPTEIHTIGIKEVKRIQKRIRDLLQEIGYDGNYIDLIATINENNMVQISDEEIISGYSLIHEKIMKALPQLFNSLPKSRCSIRTTKNACMSGGQYIQGDGKKPGIFWVNTDKIPGITFKSLALALHEMIPGHHLQNDVILQKQKLPNFRRFKESGNYSVIPARFPLYTAYMEGWALYAESLGEELGLYKNPYDLLGRLYSEIFRASRLVIDTGIHAFDWSKEQAIAYTRDVVGLPLHFATSEVYRYITWPGQACSYKIGELKIHELRSMLAHDLGNKFDVKEYHDVMLHSGEASFELIERNLKLYADSKLYEEKFDVNSLT